MDREIGVIRSRKYLSRVLCYREKADIMEKYIEELQAELNKRLKEGRRHKRAHNNVEKVGC